MDVVQALVLAIVEGVTEFLPVSSTGHMVIASHVMHIPESEFLKTYMIAIQLGAIWAVFSMYWRTFLLDWEISAKVLVAFVPTAVIGFILYKLVKQFLLGNLLVVAWAMLLGGVILVIFERFYRETRVNTREISGISYLQAVIIGVCQALAVVPGVSRSAATIIGGLMLGISRPVIVEFSFLLAVPTMLAATALDLLQTGGGLTGAEWMMLGLGFGTAFVVAFVTVRLFLRYVQRNNFTAFGIYRILAGMMLLVLASKI